MKNDKDIELSKTKLSDRCYEILQVLRDTDDQHQLQVNADYLAEHFKVKPITIYRATAILREMDLIEYKNHRFYIKPKAEQIYSTETIQNLALIASIKGLLQQYKNTPIFSNVEKLIYKIEPKVAKENGMLSTSRIAIPPQMEFNVNVTNWDKVYKAMMENKKISFRYNGPNSDKTKRRIAWPYQLLLDDGTVYLFAHNQEKNIDVLFVLNRMTEIMILNEAFELPENYDFSCRCNGGRLGAFSSQKPERFKIKFTNYAKIWIKEHKWADDQKIEETEDATIISFTSSQFDKIFQLILSWGSQARPLAPKRLVERWEQEIKSLSDMLKN